MRLSKFLVTSLVLGLTAFVGCGGGGRPKPDTVNVSGQVTLDGKPLAAADVYFISPDGEFAAIATTNAEGKYTLVQGAVPGKNKVYISKLEGKEYTEEDVAAGMDAGQDEADMLDDVGSTRGGTSGPKQLVPEEFSDPEKTKLTFDVPEGGTDSADFRF